MEGTSPDYTHAYFLCIHWVNIGPREFVMTITTVGIDLAKCLAVAGVDLKSAYEE